MSKHKKTDTVYPPEVYQAALKIIQEAQMSFGQTLKRKRQAIGLTQEELSQLSRISHGRISEYEHIRRFPTPKSRDRLINAFRRVGLSTEGLNELRRAYRDDRFRTSAPTFARNRR